MNISDKIKLGMKTASKVQNQCVIQMIGVLCMPQGDGVSFWFKDLAYFQVKEEAAVEY